MNDNNLIRNQLVDGLRQTGASASVAGEIADLAIHAATEAIKTVHRICAPLEGANGMTAGCVAYQLIEELAKVNGQELIAKMQAMPGVRSIEATIGQAVAPAAAAGSTQ